MFDYESQSQLVVISQQTSYRSGVNYMAGTCSRPLTRRRLNLTTPAHVRQGTMIGLHAAPATGRAMSSPVAGSGAGAADTKVAWMMMPRWADGGRTCELQMQGQGEAVSIWEGGEGLMLNRS